MKRTHRRKRKDHEVAINAGTKINKLNEINPVTVGDQRNASKSQEQMKKDWGHR